MLILTAYLSISWIQSRNALKSKNEFNIEALSVRLIGNEKPLYMLHTIVFRITVLSNLLATLFRSCNGDFFA